MVRPWRLELAGGHFHATLRGNDRQAIFRQDADRYRFLELLSELLERFGTRIHAYVVKDNHLHLHLETPRHIVSRSRGDRPNRQRALREVAGAVSWERIVLAVERGKGEEWMQFRDRYGDWGRDAALWLGRRCGRLKLAELGRLAGGIGEQVVSRTVRDFDKRHAQDRTLQRAITRIEHEINKPWKMRPADLTNLYEQNALFFCFRKCSRLFSVVSGSCGGGLGAFIGYRRRLCRRLWSKRSVLEND